VADGHKPSAMKNKFLRIGLLSVGILSILAVLALAKLVRPGLHKKPHGYVIDPINNVVSPQKWKEVTKKLAKWDKRLYLIQTYKKDDGVPNKKPLGTMNEMFLDKPLAEWNADAKKNHFVGSAVQIGMNIFSAETEADDEDVDKSSHAHLAFWIKESENLVKDVEPSLDAPR
jgi:hypothetical protein